MSMHVEGRQAAFEATTEAELERMGGLAWRQGNYADARRDYSRAVDMARTADDGAAEARALKNLGLADERLRRYEEARDCFQQAARAYRTLGDTRGEAAAVTQLAEVLRMQGRHGVAEAWLDEALQLCRSNGDRLGEVRTLMQLGNGSSHIGQLDHALAVQFKALALLGDMSQPELESECRNDCADIHLRSGNVASALTEFASALAIADRIGAPAQQARAHDGIAAILSRRDDRLGAYTHWSRAWHLYKGVDEARAHEMVTKMHELDV